MSQKKEPIVNGDGTRGPSTDPELDNAAAEKAAADAKPKQARGGTARTSARNGAANGAKGGAVKASSRYTITAPNRGFAGIREGVRFVDGEGEGSEAQAQALAARGYQVTAMQAKATGADRFPPGQNDLDLRDVPGIDWPTAVSLADAGVGNVSQLVAADAPALAARTGRAVSEIEGWQAKGREILAAWEAGVGEQRDKKPGEEIAPASMTPVNPPATPDA